jgi:hypothetical protein
MPLAVSVFRADGIDNRIRRNDEIPVHRGILKDVLFPVRIHPDTETEIVIRAKCKTQIGPGILEGGYLGIPYPEIQKIRLIRLRQKDTALTDSMII